MGWRRAATPKNKETWEYISKNGNVKYLRLSGGVTGIPRRVLTDHSYPSGEGISVLIWLRHGNTG